MKFTRLLIASLTLAGLMYGCTDDSSSKSNAITLVPEDTADLCADGLDNDNNGIKDCDEESCKGFDNCKSSEKQCPASMPEGKKECTCDKTTGTWINCQDDIPGEIECPADMPEGKKDCTCDKTTGTWINCQDDIKTEICDNEIDDDVDDKTDCDDEDCAEAENCKIVEPCIDKCNTESCKDSDYCTDFCSDKCETDECQNTEICKAIAYRCPDGEAECIGNTRYYCEDGVMKIEECNYQCTPAKCQSCEDVYGRETCTITLETGKWLHSYCNEQNEFIEEECPLGCENRHCRVCEDGATRCGADDKTIEICTAITGDSEWRSRPCDGICENGYCHTCSGPGTRCANGYIEKCTSGSIEVELTECEYGCLNEAQCRFCLTGQKGCSGDKITHCINGRWTNSDTVCPNGCSNGECIVDDNVDDNNNHMKDKYDGDWQNAAECIKHSECTSGFCDHFVDGGKCMNRCTEDAQCINGYMCRPDGRCAPKEFVTVWETTASNEQIGFNLRCSEDQPCNVTIIWDNETAENKSIRKYSPGEMKHTFSTAGEHTIKISTTNAVKWRILVGSKDQLRRVDAFGPIGLDALAFRETSEIKLSRVDIPDATLLEGYGLFDYSKMNDKTIRNWDMSMVDDAGYMFYNASQFNQDLSSWDVSNVTSMECMFDGASSFTGTTGWWIFKKDLNNWDVSKVKNMKLTFGYAESFRSDLSNWDVSNVTNMNSMFFYATNFNKDISKWNVSNVTDMSSMFENTSFNQDISNWDVSSVTTMYGMFDDAVDFNQDISKWDVSNVTSMKEMFYNASVFNQDISKWNVSNVTNMFRMFEFSKAFNQDISRWDVSNVTNMAEMFYNASVFNQDISGWSVSNVTDMHEMFKYSAFNQDISKWDVSNVTDMHEMFKYSAFNQDISKWNVSNVTNMSGMFMDSTFNQDISKWNVSNVTNMNKMFYEARIFDQDLSAWGNRVKNVEDMAEMFAGSHLSYKMSWHPTAIIQSKDCSRLHNIFYNTQLSCTAIKSIVQLWAISSIGCTEDVLNKSCTNP